MKSKLQRRQFISTCGKASLAGCGLLMSSGLNAASLFSFRDDEKPDPKKLNYCGYQCPADCKFKKATEENSVELKKAVYTEWRLKEKYGIEFDASQVFCYGCKTPDKPLGIAVSRCSVRACAISKNYDCCIECKELSSCDKEIWKTFPQFKEQVIQMQKKFQA